MGVGDERHLQGAVSRTERAAAYGVGRNPPPGLVESVGIYIGWAGRRLGVGEQSPSLCHAPPTQPGYPERLREVAPGRAQVSGPVDRVSAFHYRLKVTHGQGLGEG